MRFTVRRSLSSYTKYHMLSETDIHGVGTKFKKSKSYDSHGIGNLLGIQDKKEYAKKKKIFQHGFSDTANREHEPKMIEEINTFVEKIAENESGKSSDGWTEPKDMSLWCMHSPMTMIFIS